MITMAIKDLYGFCRDTNDRHMTQTEYIVGEALREFNYKLDAF